MVSFPRRHGLSGIRRAVRSRSEFYDLERPSTTEGRFGDDDTSTTTVRDVRLWVNPPTSIVQNTEFGDRVEADAIALALDGEDVQQNDRLVDGVTEYEVHGVDYLPDERNAKVLRVSLVERVN